MNSVLIPKEKYSLAQSFTELAIQNGLIIPCDDPVDTAKQVTAFFNAVVANLDSGIKSE